MAEVAGDRGDGPAVGVQVTGLDRGLGGDHRRWPDSEAMSRGIASSEVRVMASEPSRTAPIAATPAKPRRMPSLQVTPVAKERGTTGALASGNRVGDDDSPQMGGQREDSGLGFGAAAVGGGKSIYKTLGWDDDYDELC